MRMVTANMNVARTASGVAGRVLGRTWTVARTVHPHGCRGSLVHGTTMVVVQVLGARVPSAHLGRPTRWESANCCFAAS